MFNFEGMISRWIQGFFEAIPYHGKALGFILEKKLWPWFFAPILLHWGLFFVGFYLAGEFSQEVLDWLKIQVQFLDLPISSDSWFFGFIHVLIWIIVRIFFFLLLAYSSGFLVLVLLSPILSLLSQKVESLISQNQYRFSPAGFLRESFWGVVLSVRNLLLEIVLLVLLFALSFVPLLGLLTPIAVFLVTSFYYGFAIMGYNLERRKMGYAPSVSYIRRHRGRVVAMGVPFALVLLIPWVGSLFVGFVAILVTVSSSLEFSNFEKKELKQKLE